MLGGFSFPYDGVNKRHGGGGNQMNRPRDSNPRRLGCIDLLLEALISPALGRSEPIPSAGFLFGNAC